VESTILGVLLLPLLCCGDEKVDGSAKLDDAALAVAGTAAATGEEGNGATPAVALCRIEERFCRCSGDEAEVCGVSRGTAAGTVAVVWLLDVADMGVVRWYQGSRLVSLLLVPGGWYM
jgi:hypothetical protein